MPHDGKLSLRISITDRCQLRCSYCMPTQGVRKTNRHDILTFDEIVRFVRVLKSAFQLSKMRVTGGEPLVRSGAVELIRMLSAEGVSDLALTTNAQLLAEFASALKQAGLRRVNISLDSVNRETYRRMTCGGDLQRSLLGIEAALRCGLAPIKLNTVVLRGVNDGEVADIARFGLERGCEVRFLELMPINVAQTHYQDRFVPTEEVRAKLAEVFEFVAIPSRDGGSSRNYIARDGGGREGVVGFISSQTEPFCDGCGRLRLTASGGLLGCLAKKEAQDIRPLIRGSGSPDVPRLLEAIHSALRLKRMGRSFVGQDPMVTIGG